MISDKQIKSKAQARVLMHLVTYGSITTKQIQNEYGVSNAPDVIAKLRKLGYDIETIWETGVNRFGEPVKHGRYIWGRGND